MIPDELKKELKVRVSAAITPREAAVDVMKELATFYEMIYRRPVGKRVIHVCDSISCWSVGCEAVMAHLQERLGVGPGETTGDGVFTLIPCCCLGNCGEGPTMMVGDALYGRLTPEKVDEILEKERKA